MEELRMYWRFFNMDKECRCTHEELEDYSSQFSRKKGSWQAQKVPYGERSNIMLYAYGLAPYTIEDVIALDGRLALLEDAVGGDEDSSGTPEVVAL